MKKTFLCLWLVWHFVYWYATVYSNFPNQITWIYGFGLLAVGMVMFPYYSPTAYLLFSTKRIPGMATLFFFIAAYFLAFYIVSFWELFPGTTLEWGKFEMVQFAVAANFYILGRVFSEDEILEVCHWLGVLLVCATVGQMVLDRELIRFGYGWQLMLCLPASVILRKYWFVVIALLVTLASKHKTALGCALVAVAIAFVLSKAPKVRLSPAAYMMRCAFAVAAFGGTMVVVYLLFPYIAETLGRFLPEGQTAEIFGVEVYGEGSDMFRELVQEMSRKYLFQYFPEGIGYMNFALLLGEQTGVTSNAGYNIEREFIGINLHNSYLTWTIEGGILVASVVTLLFWRVWKRTLYIFNTQRNFAVLMMAWFAADLLWGVFHQLHMSMQFWGTIGIVFGFYGRLTHEPN